MNALLYAVKALQIIEMLLGLGQDALPIISEVKHDLQTAADNGVDITDAQIAALDDRRHALEQQIRDNVNK